MASAFSYSLMASEECFHPPEISKTTKDMTMNFLQDVSIWRHKIRFQIDTSKISYFTEQSIKCRKSWSLKYRTAHKCKLCHLTSPNSMDDVMSSKFRHQQSFKFFWWVELKSAFYKGQTRAQLLRDLLKIWSALYQFLA